MNPGSTRTAVWAVVAVLAAGPIAAAHDDHRTETATYVQAGSDVGPGVCAPLGNIAAAGVNVMCFEIIPRESRIDVVVEDANGMDVGIFWAMSDADGNCIETEGECGGVGCNEATIADVPPAAATFDVWVDGPIEGAVDCPSGSGAATVGMVTVTFHL